MKNCSPGSRFINVSRWAKAHAFTCLPRQKKTGGYRLAAHKTNHWGINNRGLAIDAQAIEFSQHF